MSKKKLKEMCNKKTEARKALDTRAESCTDVTELRSIIEEAKSLDEEIVELRSVIDSLPDDINDDNEPGIDDNTSIRSDNMTFNPVATYKNIQKRSSSNNQETEDVYGTIEYRNAFKNYVINGTPIPEEYRQEQRSNELTMVGDVAAVIPTNILNKVIEDITVEGKILGRITQTTFQGGVEIPISDINPTATWLTSESVVSDEQKAEMSAKISFGYHVLEAKVAIGLLTSTVSLPIFESTVVKQLKKAMIRAIETSVVVGTGVGQPLGFTKHNLPENQIIKMTSDTIGTVSKWSEVEAAIPEEEEDTLIYIMNKATWEKYLNGMTDSTGQKIGLGKINEKGQKILNGREVLTCDKFSSFDGADDGDIFGAVINLSQYMLNSNLSMYYKKYFNEDTNKWVHKALMIVDGKMAIGEVPTRSRSKKLVGAKGLLYLKKTSAGV